MKAINSILHLVQSPLLSPEPPATRVEGTLMSDPVGGVVVAAAAEGEPPPDPSTIGFFTGQVKQPITIGTMTGEMEQVTALAFVAVKDAQGRDIPAYNGDLIVYFKDPLVTDHDVWLVGVIPYKLAIAIGAITAPVIESQAVVVTPEELAAYEAAKLADFEKNRFTPASQGPVFVPSAAPPPPPPPAGDSARNASTSSKTVSSAPSTASAKTPTPGRTTRPLGDD